MKLELSLKTLYRSPVRTIFIFILLVAVTFTLFSQVLEHAVTVREIDKAAERYDGVGAVEISPPDTMDYGKYNAGSPDYIFRDERMAKPLTFTWMTDYTEQYEPLAQEQIEAVSNLPYVTSVDTRYMTAGVSNEYLRLDDGKNLYNPTAQCIVEGTLENRDVIFEDPTISIETGRGSKTYMLGFSDTEIVSGIYDLDYAGENNYINVMVQDMGTGTAGDIEGRGITVFGCSEYNNAVFAESLEIGKRYAFVITYEPLVFAKYYFFSNSLIETWSDTFWDVDTAPENWIETEEYADAKLVSNIIMLNHHTFDMVYTDDTSSIMRFANGNMIITEGRGINPKDSKIDPNVCIVSQEFAAANNLSVGDIITMNLGDKLFEQYASLGAVPLAPSRVADNYTEAELEIVGIYINVDSDYERKQEPNWAYSYNAIFVPTALLNVSEEELSNHKFVPGEVSFKVDDPWNIEAFTTEVAPQITQETMGLTLIFEDQGWLEMQDGFKTAKELGFIRIAVLSAAVLVAVWFVAMLYITGRKKDYAIMRVLGTDKSRTNKAMLLPFMLLVGLAVLVSAIAAYVYTGRTIVESNTFVVLDGFEIDTSIPVWTVILCYAAAFFVSFGISCLMLNKLGRKSPLELIQNNRMRKAQKATEITEAGSINIKLKNEEIFTELTKHKKYTRRFTWKYIFRHIRRTTVKVILSIVVAVLLLNVVGQLQIMQDSYRDLIENTVIKSNFVGGLPLECIGALEQSDYTGDIYYNANSVMDINNAESELVVTNDIERYCGDIEVSITYGAGYDESCFARRENIIVINSSTAESYGIMPGDMVDITPRRYLENIMMSSVRSYREIYPDDPITDAEIIEKNIDSIMKRYELKVVRFTVVGTFSIVNDEDLGSFGLTAFTPGTNLDSADFGKSTPLGVVEVLVADNNKIDEYRIFAEDLIGNGVSEEITFVMDTSKLENLRNTLRLVEMLYPIAVVVTLVIGAFLCGLIIVQTSKDIAIMRVLGTSKAKTRTILVLEQMILCIIGIMISGIVIYIRGAFMQMLWVFGAYALVILFASIIASVAASRKNVLELLQTKE